MLLVLEGQARAGVEVGEVAGAGQVEVVRTVHAPRDGDSAIAALCRSSTGSVAVVTADRALSAEVAATGAEIRRPGWLWQLLDAGPDSPPAPPPARGADAD